MFFVCVLSVALVFQHLIGRLFFGLNPVLPIPKSINPNHIKGFSVLSFKKHHFKINKTQSEYSLDPFVLCSRGVTLFFFLSLPNSIIAVYQKSPTSPPHTPKIFFHYLLTFCLILCYAIYIAKKK